MGAALPMPELSERDVARFWSHVDRGDGSDPDACWIWTSWSRNSKGYGGFSVRRRTLLAYRVAYVLSYGEPPSHADDGEPLVLHHRCEVEACVRPDHLVLTTDADNILRGDGACALRARSSTCPAGHPYVPGAVRRSRRNGRIHRFCWWCSLAERTYSWAMAST